MWKSTLVVISLGIDEPVRPPSYPFIHSSIHLSSFVLDTASERQNPITELCPVFFFLSFFLSFNPSIHPSNLEAYVYRPAYYLTAEPPFLSFPYRKPPSASSRPAHDARTNHPISDFSSPSLGEWNDRRCDRAALLPACPDRRLICPRQFKGSLTLTAPSHGTLRRMYAWLPPPFDEI